MRRPLTENERQVDDWYVGPDGHIREVRLRITADPSDCGRNYLRNEWEMKLKTSDSGGKSVSAAASFRSSPKLAKNLFGRATSELG